MGTRSFNLIGTDWDIFSFVSGRGAPERTVSCGFCGGEAAG